MKRLIKHAIKDTASEPYIRWLIKRTRGIKMPFDLVINEIYDRQAGEVIERVLDDPCNAIDVGCHEGQFLELYLKHSPHGQHYAFEPIPDMARALEANFPTARVFNCALTNESGEATFFVVPDAPALSGLHQRMFVAEDKARHPIVVKTERLDALIPPEVVIRLIKIDVEGAEGHVIEGAINTIRRDKPYIIFEHGATSSQDFGVPSADLYDMLVDRCDLQISLLKNWLAGQRPLSKDDFVHSKDWYFIAYPPNP